MKTREEAPMRNGEILSPGMQAMMTWIGIDDEEEDDHTAPHRNRIILLLHTHSICISTPRYIR